MGVIYLLCAIVLMILVGLIGYIIVTGLPYVNWTFLTTPADSMGMGGRDQGPTLQFSLFAGLDPHHLGAPFLGGRDLPS